MHNLLKLTKPWEQFRTELQQYVAAGNALKNQVINSAERYIELELKRQSWDKEG
jgi:hypothetical protein